MRARSILMSRGFFYGIFPAFFILFANTHSSAQNLPLSDFVIYANPDTGSQKLQGGSLLDHGVEINGNSKVLSGRIGSYYPIITTGPVNVYGSIHGTGIISLAPDNKVEGNITSSGNNCSNKDNALLLLMVLYSRAISM